MTSFGIKCGQKESNIVLVRQAQYSTSFIWQTRQQVSIQKVNSQFYSYRMEELFSRQTLHAGVFYVILKIFYNKGYQV